MPGGVLALAVGLGVAGTLGIADGGTDGVAVGGTLRTGEGAAEGVALGPDAADAGTAAASAVVTAAAVRTARLR